MALDFSIGNEDLQEKLEWVAQTPPQQGRDTHVIRFRLQEQTPGVTAPAEYRGLMVFRPRNTFQGPVAQHPGLTATGTIANRAPLFPSIPAWIRVEVFFRVRTPPQRADVFATLRFIHDNGQGLPNQNDARLVEVNARMDPDISLITLESAPERWVLDSFQRTTLLFGRR